MVKYIGRKKKTKAKHYTLLKCQKEQLKPPLFILFFLFFRKFLKKT
jgi:hypothetical protein